MIDFILEEIVYGFWFTSPTITEIIVDGNHHIGSALKLRINCCSYESKMYNKIDNHDNLPPLYGRLVVTSVRSVHVRSIYFSSEIPFG